MSRTPIVLLHGVGQGPLDLQDVISALAVDEGLGARRYLAPWIAGLRPKGPPFAMDAAVAELARAIEMETAEPAVVCGVSLGAMVAVRLAAEHPERVAALVLCGGQVRPPRRALFMQMGAFRLTPRAVFERSGVSKDRVLAVMEAVAELDLRADMAKVAVPTVVVCGSRDKANLSAARELVAGIPGAQSQVISGAGPHLASSHPRDLARVVAAVVRILEGDDAGG